MPLVSCLCPTFGRVPMLRRAIGCFAAQTHVPRELVVVYQSHDAPTRDYLRTLADPSIRAIEIAPSPHLGPDGLRNFCLEAARGDYVAVWDDDDWFAPTRLAEQLAAARVAGRAGCCLQRIFLYDSVTHQAYVSMHRAWEMSLVIERASMPRYANARGADSELMSALLRDEKLAPLDRPDLYIYIYHGGNYFSRRHWKSNLAGRGAPLASAESARVAALLATEGS